MLSDEGKTEVDIWIDEFFESATKVFLLTTENYKEARSNDCVQYVINRGLRQHYEAGYCWHFAHMLLSVFERGKVCWAAPFSHYCFVDEDGIAYDGGGRYCGEAVYLIPEEDCPGCVDGFRHIKGEGGIDSKTELLLIIKRYCKKAKLSYDLKVESFLNL